MWSECPAFGGGGQDCRNENHPNPGNALRRSLKYWMSELTPAPVTASSLEPSCNQRSSLVFQRAFSRFYEAFEEADCFLKIFPLDQMRSRGSCGDWL